MDFNILRVVEPDGDAFLRRISKHVDDVMLEYIAKEDRGFEFEENLAELRKIRDDGIIKRPLPWPPREVLNLTKWSEPHASDVRGHRARAFCCAVLMRAYGDPETRQYEQGYNSTLIQLLTSLGRFNQDLDHETMALLSWLFSRLAEWPDEECIFVGIALLFLIIKSGMRVADEDVLTFAEWLVTEEKRIFDVDKWGRGIGELPDHWLLRTTHFTQKHEKWIALGKEMSGFVVKKRYGDAVRAIGRKLAGEKIDL